MSKQQKLAEILASLGNVCVGYSGGVDSAFLAVTAADVLGAGQVLAVTGRSSSYPDAQWQAARDVAVRFGIKHLEIDTDEMQDENYVNNPANRCYYCKSELWSKLAVVAEQHRMTIVDGSNADDAHDFRPGAQAGAENNVRSPLMEAGLTKQEIRELSHARGLPTWDQPSAPCLSSRLPHGLSVTSERLAQVEAAENIVRAAGLREFRVRHHGDVARIEVARAEISAAVSAAPQISAAILGLGFERVLLDVDGYRQGSVNGATQLVQIHTLASTADVSVAGFARDIAVVAAPVSDLERVRNRAPILKQNGFKYVTVDITEARSA